MNLSNKRLKILAIWFILIGFTPPSYAASKKIEEKYGSYTTCLKQDDPECEGLLCPRTLTITKKEQKLFEVSGSIIGTAYYNGAANFLGNYKPILLINDYSGGAHCCNTYHLLDMSNNAKLIQEIEAFDSTLDVLMQGAGEAYKLGLRDTTFNYFYTSFAFSPAPRIFLKFDSNQFVCDGQAMKKDYTDSKFNLILSTMETKKDKVALESYFLNNVIELIYSGNTKFAWKLVDIFFKKHNFHDLKPEAFKKQVLCQLTKSRCIKVIEEINNGALVAPVGCTN